MSVFTMEGYYREMMELQDKLRKSEEQRFKLEEKFNEIMRMTRDAEQDRLRSLRHKYNRFIEDDRRRQERNNEILRIIQRIESRAASLSAKTGRFNHLRKQYAIYLKSRNQSEPQRFSPRPEINNLQYNPPFRKQLFPEERIPIEESYDSKIAKSKINMLEQYIRENNDTENFLDKIHSATKVNGFHEQSPERRTYDKFLEKVIGNPSTNDRLDNIFPKTDPSVRFDQDQLSNHTINTRNPTDVGSLLEKGLKRFQDFQLEKSLYDKQNNDSMKKYSELKSQYGNQNGKSSYQERDLDQPIDSFKFKDPELYRDNLMKSQVNSQKELVQNQMTPTEDGLRPIETQNIPEFNKGQEFNVNVDSNGKQNDNIYNQYNQSSLPITEDKRMDENKNLSVQNGGIKQNSDLVTNMQSIQKQKNLPEEQLLGHMNEVEQGFSSQNNGNVDDFQPQDVRFEHNEENEPTIDNKPNEIQLQNTSLDNQNLESIVEPQKEKNEVLHKNDIKNNGIDNSSIRPFEENHMKELSPKPEDGVKSNEESVKNMVGNVLPQSQEDQLKPQENKYDDQSYQQQPIIEQNTQEEQHIYSEQGYESEQLEPTAQDYQSDPNQGQYIEQNVEPTYEAEQIEQNVQPTYEEQYNEQSIEPTYDEQYSAPNIEPKYDEQYDGQNIEPKYDEQYSEQNVEPVYEENSVQPKYDAQYSEQDAQQKYEEQYSENVQQNVEQKYEEQYSEDNVAPQYDQQYSEQNQEEPSNVEPKYEEQYVEQNVEPKYDEQYSEQPFENQPIEDQNTAQYPEQQYVQNIDPNYQEPQYSEQNYEGQQFSEQKEEYQAEPSGENLEQYVGAQPQYQEGYEEQQYQPEQQTYDPQTGYDPNYQEGQYQDPNAQYEGNYDQAGYQYDPNYVPENVDGAQYQPETEVYPQNPEGDPAYQYDEQYTGEQQYTDQQYDPNYQEPVNYEQDPQNTQMDPVSASETEKQFTEPQIPQESAIVEESSSQQSENVGNIEGIFDSNAEKVPEQIIPGANVSKMLESDTESSLKQDTKVSNDSDFDFSQG